MKDINVENLKRSNLSGWLANYSHVRKVELAIYCAELVIDIYESKFNKKEPRLAIEAAKQWVKNPIEENRRAAADAADAAYAAYAAAAAAYAAYAAAYAAYAAAAAADADATAADAAYAAYAAAADAAIREKIINYIKERDEKGELKSKPKTRTEYEKVTQENTTPKQLCEMIINGDYFCDSEHCGGSYEYRDVMARYARKSESLYRKVEKEITWQDELKDFLVRPRPVDMNEPHMRDVFPMTKDCKLGDMYVVDVIKMCHLIESITDKPE
jgi:hypothetical protein